MAMNRQRRTSNINNIITYDTLGNVTIPASFTVKGLVTAGFAKVDANGLFSVDVTAYQPLLPSQTGNSGKYLTTNGSTLSWGTVSTANIYNADGTLTSARTLTSGGFPLTFTGSNTAASAIARGLNLTHTLVASANSDVLVGLDINPTFTNGAFTGVTNLGLRVNGIARINNSVTGTSFLVNGASNSSLELTTDGQGRTFINVSSNPSASSFSGAYFTANGYQESWFNVISRQASVGNRYWRFGNNGALNYFSIEKLDDNASYIASRPLTIFSSTGNVLLQGLGTSTTDGGFKLDVIGTARISGGLTINSGSTLNWNNALTAQNRILFYDDGNAGARTGIGQNAAADLVNFCYGGKNIFFAMGYDATNVTTSNASAYFDGGRRLNLNYNLLIPTGTKILMNAGQYGAIYSAASIGMVIEPFDLAAVRPFIVYQNTGGSVGIGDNSAGAINSAQLFLNSTTKGFLQPRMTTVQRDAIATPATGLQVYNTTGNTLDFYNGTSWSALASGNIYTANGTLTGNRVVTMGAFTLSFEKDLLINGVTVGRGNNTDVTNTAIGNAALRYNTTTDNTALGCFTLQSNTSGISNTGLGRAAGANNTTGSSNLFAGTNAALFSVSGGNNSIVGTIAGYGLSSGGGNTFLGYYAGSDITTGNNNIVIGSYQFGVPVLTGAISNNIVFGVQNVIKLRMFDSGNWVFQNGGTFADAGYRLDVNGTARVSDTLNLGNGLITFGNLTGPPTANLRILRATGWAVSTAIVIGSGNTDYPAITASNPIIIGNGNTVDDRSNLVVGTGNSTSGFNSTIFGTSNAVTGTGNGYKTIIGQLNTSTANLISTTNPHLIIGTGNNDNGFNGVLIGAGSRLYASNQLVIARNDGNVSTALTEVYFGNGVRNENNTVNSNNGNGYSYSINGSGPFNGTDLAGGNITINGGKGTGTGTSGDVIFGTATPTSTGTTLQTLTNRVWIKGQTGNVGIGVSPDAAYKLDVQGAARANVYYTNFGTNSINLLTSGQTAQSADRGIFIGSGSFNNGSAVAVGIGSGANIGAGVGSIAIGYATNASNGGVAIGSPSGNGAAASNGVAINGTTTNGVAIVGSSSNGGVAIKGTASGLSSIAIGGTNTSGSFAIVIGDRATSNFTSSIVFGLFANSTANNQLVIGGNDVTSSYSINDVYIGGGVQDLNGNNGTSITINASGGANATDKNGGNIKIAGGKGTGAGTSGDVIFATATPTTSGTTLQTLTNRVWIKGSTGNVGIGSSPAAINSLQVGTANQWSGAFIGNMGGNRTPSTNYGLHLGWNYTGGSGEANILWGIGDGVNPYLTFSSWDGTSKVDRMIMSDIGKLTLPAYLTSTSFSGTPVGHLAFDLSGNIITVPVPSSVNIYNSNGTLTGNRTISTATGFKLTLNPNLEVITTTYNVIPTMLGWSAVNGYVQTTIPASTSFSSIGYAFSALIGNNYMTYQGSATFAANTFTGAVVGINNIGFTAASSTITITQSSSIKTYSAGLFQNTTSGSVNGTITHMSGLAVRPIFQASGTSVITVTNNYGLLIADQNEFNHATISNRWGIYQEGISDNNYFSSKLLVGTATDIASAKVIIDSTSQGLLVPRMTTTQINAITSPAEGLQVYNTTISHMCFYMNGAWAKINHSPM